MPKRAVEFTPAQIKKLTHPGDKKHSVKIAVGGVSGLYIQIAPTGHKSWVLRGRFGEWDKARSYNGQEQRGRKKREFGLGPYPEVLLGQARDKARAYKAKLAEGIDPVAERKAAQEQATTFATAMRAVHDEIGKGWTPKTQAGFLSRMDTYAIPHLGTMQVGDIEAHDIIAALSPFWTDKPAIAKKVRHGMMQVLKYAKARGWRETAVPLPDEVSQGLPKQPAATHHKAMPYSEIPAWLANEISKADSPARLALLFTILTGARSGETRKAQWSQIDLVKGEWKRPAEIMKARKEHTVSLNNPALAILKRAEAMRDASGLLFPNAVGKPLSDAALTKLFRDGGRSETVHGFRSALRDFAGEKMPTIPFFVAETALAHEVGNSMERAYLRSDFADMRKQLMDAWGHHCAPMLSGESGNVVPLQVAK